MSDTVEHPGHYTRGGIECWDAISAALGPDGFCDYCRGNVIKYLWRCRDKGGVEDLRKARQYLDRMISDAQRTHNYNEESKDEKPVFIGVDLGKEPDHQVYAVRNKGCMVYGRIESDD